ncbi:unnamed protein product [Arctogadus glacialis]
MTIIRPRGNEVCLRPPTKRERGDYLEGNKDRAGHQAVTGEQGHSGDSSHRETRTERGQQTQGNKDRAGTADTGTRTERGQ